LAASEGMEPNWAAWQQAASSKMVAVALATNLWYWGVRTEIHVVERLILIEAGEHHGLLRPVTGSLCCCRHCAQISFIMHCIGELMLPMALWPGFR
jgi:hypothetical protein